jgi:hypothetical protein
MSRRIFGPKREEVVGGWRRLHNQELHNLYASPNIVRVIKSRRMRWTVHVARTGKMKIAQSILVGGEDWGVDGKIKLIWIIGKLGGAVRSGLLWFWKGTSGGPL